MFTSKTERKPIMLPSATENIDPGQYNTNKSTLRPLHQSFKHNISTDYKFQPTVIEEEIIKHIEAPPPGLYDPKLNPSYIRLAPANTSSFSSGQQRFYVAPKIQPGPQEYFQPCDPVQIIQTRPNYAKPAPDPNAQQSIPFTRPKVEKTVENTRSAWLLNENAERLQNPAPNQYVQEEPILLERENKIVPAVGGSSLTKYKHESPWVHAQNRDTHVIEETVGPGYYNEYKKQAKQMTIPKAERGEIISVNDTNYEIQSGIEQTLAKQKQKMQQQNELKQSQQMQQIINQKLHPSIHPENVYFEEKPKFNYLTQTELNQINNPPVGSYILKSEQQMKQQRIQEVKQMKSQKGIKIDVKQITAPSIPALERIYEEHAGKEQKEPVEPFTLKPNRDLDKIVANDSPAPGQYDARSQAIKLSQPVQASIKGTAAFVSAQKREFNSVKEIERQMVLQEQNRRKYVEEQLERRQTGGEETQINYNMARYQGVSSKLTFGSTAEREKFSSLYNNLVLDNPGPGQYDAKISKKEGNQIMLYERMILNDKALPAVLKEDIGPGAQKALKVIAERRAVNGLIGPQSYQNKMDKRIKKSFNATSEDNRVE
ncbi:Conserved_hypothetical protein [Hexamita inflata]|uniref:Uncharacterized protein n=1 Tax=Hexamita inflata TaxID=28002 RepID=A0AA86QXE1_9EUKA|nr:Conserved hypothetical protein [Hexamita inflata]